jgi:hypothetical protein
MIVAPSQFQGSYRKLLKNNDFVLLSTYNDVTTVCINYDDNLKTMIKNVRAAHAEAREYINDNS